MLDKRYKTLDVIAATGSYTQAAKELYITQPAVSQQINSLENELDLKLIKNIHGKIHLTTSGIKLAEMAHKTELESQKLIKYLQRNDDKDYLNLGCTLSLSSTLLPYFISCLPDSMKLAKIKIGNTATILEDIRKGSLNIGLIEGNYNSDDFDSILIRKEPFICVANPNVNVHNGVTIETIFDQPLLVRESGSGSREILETWLATQNYQISDFLTITEIASPSAIIEVLKQNSGISFIYESLVKDELKKKTLKKLDIKGFKIEHPINLVFFKNSYFKNDYQHIVETL